MSSCHYCNATTAGPDITFKLCSRCRLASYCSTQCQKEDWPRHKSDCRFIHGLVQDRDGSFVCVRLARWMNRYQAMLELIIMLDNRDNDIPKPLKMVVLYRAHEKDKKAFEIVSVGKSKRSITSFKKPDLEEYSSNELSKKGHVVGWLTVELDNQSVDFPFLISVSNKLDVHVSVILLNCVTKYRTGPNGIIWFEIRSHIENDQFRTEC